VNRASPVSISTSAGTYARGAEHPVTMRVQLTVVGRYQPIERARLSAARCFRQYLVHERQKVGRIHPTHATPGPFAQLAWCLPGSVG